MCLGTIFVGIIQFIIGICATDGNHYTYLDLNSIFLIFLIMTILLVVLEIIRVIVLCVINYRKTNISVDTQNPSKLILN
jgi:heme/copper-type cytochrome/quinol oxidase subunit 2